jgi:hypothetical protein
MSAAARSVYRLLKEKENMRSKWTYDLDAVEQAASVIERELMTVLDRLNIQSRPQPQPASTEASFHEGLNAGERLYAALKALQATEEEYREMLKTWELSPDRQAEFPTEDVVLDGYPDPASIELRLKHGFALVRLKKGELAWASESSLVVAQEFPFLGDDLDGAVVLLTPGQPRAT